MSPDVSRDPQKLTGTSRDFPGLPGTSRDNLVQFLRKLKIPKKIKNFTKTSRYLLRHPDVSRDSPRSPETYRDFPGLPGTARDNLVQFLKKLKIPIKIKNFTKTSRYLLRHPDVSRDPPRSPETYRDFPGLPGTARDNLVQFLKKLKIPIKIKNFTKTSRYLLRHPDVSRDPPRSPETYRDFPGLPGIIWYNF